ncbi:hypothetical protein Tco_0975500 [Tanacetum coccineum]|uniref:Uncharacterized protein n=1 Tax=Tanacetum coccineum TaxID=301880 RepID=A0ABQ5EEV4_9ASTR
MRKRQRELPTSTRRRSKRHIQEVVSAADNGEVVKETQLLDSHEDVFQLRASKRMKKETLLSDWPPVIGNYLKEIHIARWEENLTRDSNAPKTRIHVLKEVLDYLNQAKKPRHWFPWGNDLNVNEKFWQSLVARDATSRGFLTLSVRLGLVVVMYLRSAGIAGNRIFTTGLDLYTMFNDVKKLMLLGYSFCCLF